MALPYTIQTLLKSGIKDVNIMSYCKSCSMQFHNWRHAKVFLSSPTISLHTYKKKLWFLSKYFVSESLLCIGGEAVQPDTTLVIVWTGFDIFCPPSLMTTNSSSDRKLLPETRLVLLLLLLFTIVKYYIAWAALRPRKVRLALTLNKERNTESRSRAASTHTTT